MWHREWPHSASAPALNLDKAIEISLAMESADRNAKDLQKQPPMVNAVQHKPPSRAPPLTKETPPNTQTVECYRYGGPHLAPDCRFKDTECRLCKKKGHLARVCCSKKVESSRLFIHTKEEWTSNEEIEHTEDMFCCSYRHCGE